MSLSSHRKNTRHSHVASMADAEPPSSHAQSPGCLGCAATKLDLRRGPWRTVYHHIGERDARTKARAKRLEHRLFGGEPPSQPFDPIGAIADFLEFGLYEAAWNQRIAWIVDPAPQLGNLNEVDSMPHYIHSCPHSPV